MHNNEHVDTRGIWPAYVNGLKAIRLIGKPLDISLEDARAVASQLE